MGSKIDLLEEQHKLLAACIQDMIQGEQVFIPYPEEVEKTAQFCFTNHRPLVQKYFL